MACAPLHYRSMLLKGRLHGRKIGYGLVKKGVRTSHFCPCKQFVPCFGGWVRTRVFSSFGAIDVYGPKTRKNTGPYSFFNSYVSLHNNFANDMRSKKLCGSGDKNVVGFNMAADSSSAWKNEEVEALKTDLSTVQ